MSHVLAGASNTTLSHSNLYSTGRDLHNITNLNVTNVFDSNSTRGTGELISYIAKKDGDPGQERWNIADWLSSLNFKVSQLEFLQKKQDGTGEWLLESDMFKDWRDGILEILWCPGIPGSGKTILASIVVNHLQTVFKVDDKVAITCIYLNYKEQNEQTVPNLMASLLKQIVQDQPTMSKSIQALYEHHRNRKTRPILDQLTETLKLEIGTYSKFFIVVDALDECEQHETRTNLLRALRSLTTTGTVRLMVTSRDIPSIAREFEATEFLDIRANDQDVRRYIEGRIAAGPRHLRGLQESIVNHIVQNVAGMFLLARLHMDSLMGKLNARGVRKALEELPKGVDHTYDEAMARIERQDQPRAQLAEQVLSWITYAFRPLSVEELQHALAIELETTSLDPEAIIDEELLTSVCAGLVVIDEERRIIRLVHYTAQKYFDRVRESRFPKALVSITSSCLTYLSFDNFKSDKLLDFFELSLVLRTNVFLDYSVNNWGLHARGSVEQSIKDLALAFLRENSNVAYTSQFLCSQYPTYRIYFLREPKHFSGVHLSSFFGLEKILCHQLKNGHKADMGDGEGRTPLSIAAWRGHEAVVKMLLAVDSVNLNSGSRNGQTPMSYAAEMGHDTVVKLLLAVGDIDLNSEDQFGRTPLSYAAKMGHDSVVKLLLAVGDIDLNLEDQYGRTPLSYAAEMGHDTVVKLLLAVGDVDLNAKDLNFWTPLSYAAERGHDTVVKLLLTRDDIDVNADSTHGFSPLIFAATQGHDAVVKLLLARDDIDASAYTR